MTIYLGILAQTRWSITLTITQSMMWFLPIHFILDQWCFKHTGLLSAPHKRIFLLPTLGPSQLLFAWPGKPFTYSWPGSVLPIFRPQLRWHFLKGDTSDLQSQSGFLLRIFASSHIINFIILITIIWLGILVITNLFFVLVSLILFNQFINLIVFTLCQYTW